MANAPVSKVVVGNVSVAVFENVVVKGKDQFTAKSVTIQKSYKDKDGEWQSSNSFKPSELFYVIMALQKTLDKIYRKDEVDSVEFPDVENNPF